MPDELYIEVAPGIYLSESDYKENEAYDQLAQESNNNLK